MVGAMTGAAQNDVADPENSRFFSTTFRNLRMLPVDQSDQTVVVEAKELMVHNLALKILSLNSLCLEPFLRSQRRITNDGAHLACLSRPHQRAHWFLVCPEPTSLRRDRHVGTEGPLRGNEPSAPRREATQIADQPNAWAPNKPAGPAVRQSISLVLTHAQEQGYPTSGTGEPTRRQSQASESTFVACTARCNIRPNPSHAPFFATKTNDRIPGRVWSVIFLTVLLLRFIATGLLVTPSVLAIYSYAVTKS